MNKYFRLLFMLRIHPTTWVIMAIAILTAHIYEMLMLLAVVLVHEMGHACAAAHFKWRIKSITLLPFGGVLDTEEHGNRPLKEDLMVILFGPIQHLVLFLLVYLAYISGVADYETYVTFLYINSTICLFNLLPIWPLDGGKLLFLLFSLKYSFLKSHLLILRFSILFSVALFTFCLLSGQMSLNIILILSFICFAIVMEWRQRQYVFMRFLLERHYGKNSEMQRLISLTVDENKTVHEILQLFQRGCKHPIIVMKNGKERGMLDENEVLHAYFSEKMTGVKIGDLLYSY
ncbi:M50 family metallopeptidase [Bacillus sp. AGMB 02131]|uniref:M50 family metallopeptidase n=1 Tax=Peribacillus faecalis TaxID=2772559 RepID=A0A927HBX1_9BACI|nr:M50 family metallopeptidase [Peribacillus faecalis]MBD3107843.1 M50 family metallopeptidase [Peribacillus faecalis]